MKPKGLGRDRDCIDLIEDIRGLAEVAVLRRQVDGRSSLKGLPVDTLKGAKQRKQDKPVDPAEIFLGIASYLLF